MGKRLLYFSVLLFIFGFYFPINTRAEWLEIGQSQGIDGTGDINSNVYAVAADKNGNIYVGGSFISAGGIHTGGIARWNGTSWSRLGGHIIGGATTFTVDEKGNLYAGGYFTLPGDTTKWRVVKWDGNQWHGLGKNLTLDIRAIVVDGKGSIYAAGVSNSNRSDTATDIVKWNGSAWNVVGVATRSFWVGALALALDSNDNLFVGGRFDRVNSVPVKNVAKWDGTTWSTVGNGISNTVRVLIFDKDGYCYAGSDTVAGTTAVHRWDGTDWNVFGSGFNGFVSGLAFDKNRNCYVVGGFSFAGGVAANHVARWNGSVWSSVGSGLEGDAFSGFAVAVDMKGTVYAGGTFSRAGGKPANNIALWDGTEWGALGAKTGNGLNGIVRAFAMDQSGNIYVGGEFTTAGVQTLNYIGKWDGSRWQNLEGGSNGPVHALTFDKAGNLFAGGEFDSIGSIAANCIAKWDGTTWSPLIAAGGSRVSVDALASDNNGNIYIGGNSSLTGSRTIASVDRWDGEVLNSLFFSSYFCLDRVYTLAVDRSRRDVYAGGYRVGWNVFARWDGTAWDTMSGVRSESGHFMQTSCVDKASFVYAGGSFTSAGGMNVNNIAKWNGEKWMTLGEGRGETYALAVDGKGTVYAGGRHKYNQAMFVDGLSKWDGIAWNGVGNDVIEYVDLDHICALICDNSDKLYIGGDFLLKDGKASPNFVVYKPDKPTSARPGVRAVRGSRFESDITRQSVTFFLDAPEMIDVRVFSLAGKELSCTTEMLPSGRSYRRINTSGLATGTYIVQMKTANESLQFCIGKIR